MNTKFWKMLEDVADMLSVVLVIAAAIAAICFVPVFSISFAFSLVEWIFN